jgi:hypothetical protein
LLLGVDVGMLELDHEPMLGFYIGDVSLSGGSMMNDLLVLRREFIFPSPVPERFPLPPVIAGPLSFVGPVPDSPRAAFRNDRLRTSGAAAV